MQQNKYMTAGDKQKEDFSTKEKVMVCGQFTVAAAIIILVITLNSAYNGAVEAARPLTSSISSGHLEATIKDAHMALKSVRHVTDKLDTDKLLKEWEHTNGILEKNKIPWKELPQWRLFAQHALRSVINELEKNPHMISDLKETSKNILHSVHPVMQESKEWRKGLRGALYSTAKSVVKFMETKESS